jgi:SM-20-related protein
MTEQCEWSSVAEDLRVRGWAVVEDFLSPAELAVVRDWVAGERAHLVAARVGRDRRLDPAIRGDQTHWVEDLDLVIPGGALARRFEQLREALNRQCLLGLESLELHLACYPPGARYAAHLDRVRGDDARMLSAVLYLNAGWQLEDGGELRIYAGDTTDSAFETVAPQGGRLALFITEGCLHEVRPARRERWSLTGWFRRRGAN